jgi:aminopeptidase N
MMVNDNPLPDRADAIELTDHEIFHTMFPFYMGINETKYAWMDEGWATIGEWVISPIIDTSIIDEYGVGGYQSQAGKETDLPMISLSTEEGRSYFVNSYPKPGLVYFYLRDLLGETLFNKAMHYYIDQWHGKHPIPYDFFNCINTGSGKNLNWFWKKWFYETAVPDLAITEVKKVTGGYNLILDSKGDMPVPVDITLTLASGEIQKIHRSAAVWEKSKRLLVFFPTKSAITAATLGSTYVPDVNKKDNSWKSK